MLHRQADELIDPGTDRRTAMKKTRGSRERH